MDYRKKYKDDVIDIPFGAKDSELLQWEYTIPEGMEAVIEGGKVVVKKKESEDEKTRKGLLHHLKELKEWKVGEMSPIKTSSSYDAWIAYLEKQKEQDKCPEYCVRSHCIGCPIYEKQKEQKPAENDGKEMLYVCNKSYKIGFREGVESVKPAEWSEEDEKMLKHIISDLREFRDCETDEELLSDYEDEIVWLKSLRPSWKPSEEQMGRLVSIVAALRKNNYDDIADAIAEIYHGLEKLM